jgi:nucleoside-diphosphate-sugar epimerase
MINWSNQRVVVTGGTGFMGSVLIEELLKRGAHVKAPIRSRNFRSLSTLRAKVEWLEGDLRDPDYCRELITGANYIIHLASQRRTTEFHREHSADVLLGNLEMSIALAEACKEYPHAKVVFLSTANVPPELDVVKVSQQDALDGFVLGKALSEALWFTASKQYHFPLLVLRPVGAYGERDTFTVESNMIPSFMVRAEEAETELVLWGSGKEERVFLYIDDVIEAIFRLMESDATGIQYIMPPETMTVECVARAICDLVNPSLSVKFDASHPISGRSLAVLPNHSCLDDLPWTSLEEGLKKTYEGWKGVHRASSL